MKQEQLKVFIKKQHEFILEQDKLIQDLFEMSRKNTESWASFSRKWCWIWLFICIAFNLFWGIISVVVQNG